MRSLIVLGLIAILAAGAVSVGPAAAASDSSTPESKQPEVTTIGPAPAGMAAVHQAKLVEVLRLLELRRATAARQPVTAAGFGLPHAIDSAPKAPFFETRQPATAPRNRFKAIDLVAPAAPAAPKVIVKAPAAVKATTSGGRP